MSIRKSSTDKAPKAPKAKKEKVKKEKVKKGKKSPVVDDAVSFDNDTFDAPMASKKGSSKPKRKSPKAPKDVYTLVLLLSFLFFIAATVFLYMDLASYK